MKTGTLLITLKHLKAANLPWLQEQGLELDDKNSPYNLVEKLSSAMQTYEDRYALIHSKAGIPAWLQ